jgi:hypothetical protein
MEDNMGNLALSGKAPAAISVFRHCIDAVKSAVRVRRRKHHGGRSLPTTKITPGKFFLPRRWHQA